MNATHVSHMPSSGSLFENKFSLVTVASTRARQLYAGARPTGVSTSDKNTRIAEHEIRFEQLAFLPVSTLAPLPRI